MAKKGNNVFDDFVGFFDKTTLIVTAIITIIVSAILGVYLVGGIGNFVPDTLKYEKINGSIDYSKKLSSATEAESIASKGTGLFTTIFDFLDSTVGMLTLVALVVVIGFVFVALKKKGGKSVS